MLEFFFLMLVFFSENCLTVVDKSIKNIKKPIHSSILTIFTDCFSSYKSIKGESEGGTSPEIKNPYLCFSFYLSFRKTNEYLECASIPEFGI